MVINDQLRTSIHDALYQRPEVIAGYLFGSALTTENPGDIDVAVLVDATEVNKKAYPLGYLAELRESLILALRQDDVDIVLLNRASPIICMQVLRKGVKVFERSPARSNEFFVRTLNFYHDLKRVRRPIERNVLNGRLYA